MMMQWNYCTKMLYGEVRELQKLTNCQTANFQTARSPSRLATFLHFQLAPSKKSGGTPWLVIDSGQRSPIPDSRERRQEEPKGDTKKDLRQKPSIKTTNLG